MDQRPIGRRNLTRSVMLVLALLVGVVLLVGISLVALHRHGKAHPATAPKPSIESLKLLSVSPHLAGDGFE